MPTNTKSAARYDGNRNLSPEEMARQRDARLEQLLGLLAERRMSGPDIADALGVSRGSAHDYLRRLDESGEAKRTGTRDQYRRELWTFGSAVEIPAGVTIVPARQIGMFRHWLDIAFFGPATGGAAA
jgi:DNA-binding Lrp family transcriptional regulator